ncbi:hypothetical protein HZS55_21070 [Halosimplex rubrum]|uniref:Uncharacterized protein n=1 Tax=Halosimplex rubrum TaxID=869889 RepID=A0A7D5T873_9EURY|nr:hypothetical protein [Halosimplex rubrum]QLH79633.1 hypothetical protein HZS55_21070 [Halosimplex rubrum]
MSRNGDGGPDRGRGELNSSETGGADGNVDVGEEGPDDSATGTLRSMGYIDGDGEVGRGDGAATSEDSTLQTVVIVTVVALFVLALVFLLLQTVLGLFGAAL